MNNQNPTTELEKVETNQLILDKDEASKLANDLELTGLERAYFISGYLLGKKSNDNGAK